MSNYITTYTGRHFYPTAPDPDAILIEDIAHALSLICRGNGHIKTFWSVGQHSICCAKEASARGLSNRMVLACLLHDASECYMSDIPRPFKEELPEYRERESRLLDMIYEKFLGSVLTQEEQEQLKEIDDALLWYDLENLLDEVQFGFIPDVHIELDYSMRQFQDVEKEYLELYYLYSGKEMPKPVYLEDIAEAFDSCWNDWSQFLNTRTGEIVSVPDDPGLSGFDEDEELWEEIEAEDYFVRLPNQRELHELQIMRDFTATCVHGKTESRLWRALNGRHPYRYFKDAIDETGVAQKYYDFRLQEYTRVAEEWCRKHKIRFFRKT